MTTYGHTGAALQLPSAELLLSGGRTILMVNRWKCTQTTKQYKLEQNSTKQIKKKIVCLFVFFFPSGSKSQSALWNAITAGIGIKGKEQKPPLNDPRSPEEILAEDLPATDEPDATEKTAIRFACVTWL